MILLYSDYHYSAFDRLHRFALTTTYTLQQIINWPFRSIYSLGLLFQEKQVLLREQQQLQRKLVEAGLELQKYTFVIYENIKLRELLLGKSSYPGVRYTLVEPVALAMDQFDQRFTINKGERDGVYLGQPVLAAEGVVGRVIAVEKNFSRVMPLSDRQSAIPALVVKSSLHTIVVGTGREDSLELSGITATAHVAIGDLVVTSAIGGIFPFGYPIGEVMKIISLPGEKFLRVLVRPRARVGNSLFFLLLWYPREDNLARAHYATEA